MTAARGRVCPHCGLWLQFGFFPAACGGSIPNPMGTGTPDDPRHNTVQPKARQRPQRRVRCSECSELVYRDSTSYYRNKVILVDEGNGQAQPYDPDEFTKYYPGENHRILRTYFDGGWICNEWVDDHPYDCYDVAPGLSAEIDEAGILRVVDELGDIQG